jgi:hypothetical protein
MGLSGGPWIPSGTWNQNLGKQMGLIMGLDLAQGSPEFVYVAVKDEI